MFSLHAKHLKLLEKLTNGFRHLRAFIIYDSRHEAGATRTIAECIANTLREGGIEATLCRPKDPCPDPRDFDLIVVGTPIYYERPMKSVLEFIDRNDGLVGLKVAVFITCFAASKKVPAPIRNAVIRRYLNSVLKHVKGEAVASKAFRGWLRGPNPGVLKECVEWGEALAKIVSKA